MATKRSALLKGSPEIFEDGVAAGVISPGHLVKDNVSGVAVQTVSDARVPALIALERDELGEGFDDTYQSYASDVNYAVGDRVKVAALYPGCVATMYIASGQNIQKDELLGSNGDGALKSVAAASAIFVSLEEVGTVSEATAIKVRAI